jgi:hypothetical protein
MDGLAGKPRRLHTGGDARDSPDSNSRNDLSGRISCEFGLPVTVSELMSQLDPTLFSDRWLDTCHRLFWVKVLPIIPVLHGPTMQCSRVWEPLLISMLTLGSLHIEGSTSKAKVSMHHLQRQDYLTLRVFPCGE